MFLPINIKELNERGSLKADFVIVSGDAYVDHPSFGHAVIARLLESEGFAVGVISQPLSNADFMAFGAPSKAFMISGGVVDSMVNNYSAAKNKRGRDEYSEGGRTGMRPDRNVDVYTKTLKRLFPDVPVIIGGIEASLRRLSHYDYWDDNVRHSILYTSGADLLIYGMGEYPISVISGYAKKGVPLAGLRDVPGTAYLTMMQNAPEKIRRALSGNPDEDTILLSSHERVSSDKKLYAKMFVAAKESADGNGKKTLVQKQSNELFAVINPPSPPLSEAEMDKAYSIKYERKAHPMYKQGVPAIEEVEFSVTAHRGCFGNCSFCALTYHQGRIIQSRSADSIISEVKDIAASPDFKGYIHDIGGPSANFHRPSCDKQSSSGVCSDKNCIGYKRCPNLSVSHAKYLEVLRRARAVKGVKKVFVRSGLRYDYIMQDKDRTFFEELVEHHISGQLKVAPEHSSDAVLEIMNKPPFAEYLKFSEEFARINKKRGKQQFLVPYFISSHPGCTLKDAINLTEYLKSIGYMPKQVQDFYPTPSTLATTMYYTEMDPYTLKPVYVAKSPKDKAMQRALLQYRLPVNKKLVDEAYRLAGPKPKAASTKAKQRNKNSKTKKRF